MWREDNIRLVVAEWNCNSNSDIKNHHSFSDSMTVICDSKGKTRRLQHSNYTSASQVKVCQVFYAHNCRSAVKKRQSWRSTEDMDSQTWWHDVHLLWQKFYVWDILLLWSAYSPRSCHVSGDTTWREERGGGSEGRRERGEEGARHEGREEGREEGKGESGRERKKEGILKRHDIWYTQNQYIEPMGVAFHVCQLWTFLPLKLGDALELAA